MPWNPPNRISPLSHRLAETVIRELDNLEPPWEPLQEIKRRWLELEDDEARILAAIEFCDKHLSKAFYLMVLHHLEKSVSRVDLRVRHRILSKHLDDPFSQDPLLFAYDFSQWLKESGNWLVYSPDSGHREFKKELSYLAERYMDEIEKRYEAIGWSPKRDSEVRLEHCRWLAWRIAGYSYDEISRELLAGDDRELCTFEKAVRRLAHDLGVRLP